MATKHSVYIYPVPNRAENLEALRVMIAGLHCTIEVSEPAHAEVIVVLVCSETPDDEVLKDTVAPAADGKIRAVGVYAPDSDGALPTALQWYGTSAVPMDAEKLRSLICRDEGIWDNARGNPRGEQQMVRRCK